VTTPIAGRVRVALRTDYRRRVNGAGAWLVGARVTQAIGRAELYVDGTNLLNETYVEVPGVAMPGRWITAGVCLR
jgi:outer membrane receptor protein involved in Fe transport